MTHDLVSFVEEKIVEYMMAHYRDAELRRMDTIQDILHEFPLDAEDDLKDEVWKMLLTMMDGKEVLFRIRNLLAEESSSEEESESEEEGEESSCE